MAFRTVMMPADAGLSRLLRAGLRGTAFHKHFGDMSNAAKPDHPARSVLIPAPLVPVVADGLRELLREARAAADPGAPVLAAFAAAQFGVTEDAPPAAVPATPAAR